MIEDSGNTSIIQSH